MLCSSGVLVGKRKGGFGKLKQVTMPPKQAKPKEDIEDMVEKAESTPKEVVPEVIVEKTVESNKEHEESPPSIEEEEEERAMRGPQIPDRLKDALQKEAAEEELPEPAASDPVEQPESESAEPEPEPKEKRGRKVT